jgi:hypothetical protein
MSDFEPGLKPQPFYAPGEYRALKNGTKEKQPKRLNECFVAYY